MELDEKLVEFLMGIEQRISKAEDWVASEIPAYVSEILTYHTVVYIFGLVVYLCFLLVSVYLGRDAARVSNRLGERANNLREQINGGQLNERELGRIDDQIKEARGKQLVSDISVLLFSGVAIFMGVSAAYEFSNLVKIQLAPRVYVVDYIRSELGKELGKENDRSDSNW